MGKVLVGGNLEQTRFNPEYELDHNDRMQLAGIYSQPGFQILQRICGSEVDKFYIKLVNTESDDTAGVLAAHKMYKAAAQFYEGLVRRINEEMIQFTGTVVHNDKPEPDVTEGTLDFGEFASKVEDLPNVNFFASEEELF